MTIQRDASKTGWGAFASSLKTGSVWSSTKKTKQNNILELKIIYLVLLGFTKETKNTTVHLQIDNIFALTHLQKSGEPRI